MKTTFTCTVSTVISTILMVLLSLLDSYGNNYPAGPESMFIIPMLFIYVCITLMLVYPLTHALLGIVSYFVAVIIMSILFTTTAATFFYSREVDNSFIPVLIIFLIYLGLPWFIGGILGSKFSNVVLKKMPNKSLNQIGAKNAPPG